MREVTPLRPLLALLLLPVLIVTTAQASALERCVSRMGSGCPCADETLARTQAPATLGRACCCAAEEPDAAPVPSLPTRVEQSSSVTIAAPSATTLPRARHERLAARRPEPPHRLETGPPILLKKQSFLI